MKMSSELKEIVQLLKRMDSRISSLENGKSSNGAPTAPEPTPTDLVCQKVRKDLDKKQLVKLSNYGKGQELRWAREELSKDKSLRVIIEGEETFIIKETTQKTQSLIVVGREKEPKTRRAKGHGKVQDNINKILDILESGRKITAKKIARTLKVSEVRAVDYLVKIGKMRGYQAKKTGRNNHWELLNVGFQAKHEPPMQKKTAYNKFMAEKLRYYQKQAGLNAHDAFMSSVADWQKAKKSAPQTEGQTAPPQARSGSFPAFQSIKEQFRPILIGVMERLFLKGVEIDYRGVGYALDLKNEAEYLAFAEEVMNNTDALRHYFQKENVSLRWTGKVIKIA